MTKNAGPTIHDNFLLGYKVDSNKREVTLKTEFRDQGGIKYTQVIFSGVEAYQFQNDSFNTILFSVEEIDPLKLLEENWESMKNGYGAAGWPGPWAKSMDIARMYLSEKKVRAFSIDSSIGMSGWVIADKMEFIESD